MIDFKKEIMKFQPAKSVEDVQDGIIVNEIKDLGELLQYIATQGRRGERGESWAGYEKEQKNWTE